MNRVATFIVSAGVLAVGWATAVLAKPAEITWEDLMPEGEYERLEQLYADYIADLESQLLANQEPLMMSDPDMFMEGSSLDRMDQIGTFNTVAELDGKEVRLAGYVVPFDFDSEGVYSEFLLVPYFGACIHTPPPPPNQIVYVKTKKAVEIDNIWNAVWVEGTLSSEQHINDTGDAAYTLALSKVEPY